MMCRFIKFLRGGLNGFVRGKCHLQQLVHPCIDFLLREVSLCHCLQQLPGTAQTGRWHFQRRAVLYALHMVVRAAPVGNDRTIESPFLPQDIHQQVLVFVGIHTVHLIIGGHDSFGMSFPDHNFKSGEVQLPKCTLVQNGIACHTAQLLTVGGKVLRTSRHAVCLNAPDVGGCHLSGEVGVLGEILKAASAQRAALQVEPRSQQDVDPVCGGLLTQHPADFFAQRRIPAVCHGGGGGKAGGRHGGVQAQMVGSACLLAQAVGTIRQPDDRHALLGVVLGLPCIFAGEQRTFLLQRQFCNDILMFHGKAPFCGNEIFLWKRDRAAGLRDPVSKRGTRPQRLWLLAQPCSHDGKRRK